MELPIYYFDVDENGDPKEGVQAIALVDKPAIISQWLAFSEQEKTDYYKFAVQNEEQRIVTGAVLIPDLPVYRELNGEKFYVAATAETIKKIAYKFMRENRNLKLKDTHDAVKDTTQGVYIYQTFIQDDTLQLKPKGFDLPNGTWFISCKIDNPIIWEKVKNGTFNGFSMEGYLDINTTPIRLEDSDIQKIINSIV
jgi:hypothetical protein